MSRHSARENRSPTDTRPHCTYGGHAGPWRPAAPCSRAALPDPADPLALRTSSWRRARSCRRSRLAPSNGPGLAPHPAPAPSATSPTGTWRRTHVLEASPGLVHAAHPDETPLVVDPFAGGGSIPLEALRLAVTPSPPTSTRWRADQQGHAGGHPPTRAEAGRGVPQGGAAIKAGRRRNWLSLPEDPDGAPPIAYLGGTVRCESPNCGAEIPLMRSFWLCKKAKRSGRSGTSVRKARRAA